MGVAVCTTEGRGYPHVPLLLYAGPTEHSPTQMPVQAWQESGSYELSNFYADGIRGVNDEDRIEAEVDEQPTCGECHCLIDHWEHAS